MKTKKINYLLVLTTLSLLSVFAQEPDFVKNEVLVQLEKNYSSEQLMSDTRSSQFQINKADLVSKHSNIWQLSFTGASEAISEQKVIKELYINENVLIAQKNHILTNRATTPNDTRIDRQWQYFQSNDKDIDAYEAWDIATGGMTANGHEIVVAIIDDGIDLQHSDMVDNLWVNTQEIANKLGISDRSVIVSRYRLRKKTNAPKGTPILEYLNLK